MNERLTVVLTRHLQRTLEQRLDEEPVIVVSGPRTVGKSTLLRQLADSTGVQVFDLDDLTTRAAVAADPDLFAAGRAPVLIDEFQHVPELLDSIKALLNVDLRAGRFVLTGSTRYATLPQAAQSLTGRVHVMTLWPLSQGEIRGQRETFLGQLLDEPAQLVSAEPSTTSRADYAVAVFAGGLPLALRRAAGRSRNRWFSDYVRLVIERDVLDIRRVRQRDLLPALLRRLAGQTAETLNISEAARQVGLEVSVAHEYVTLLESVFLLHRLPAWGRTLSSRAAGLPKVHLVDSGLGGWLLGLTSERLAARDPAVLTEYGHLLETFAVNEILKQASWAEETLSFGHFRTHDGAEVDLVIEGEDERVVALEVKSAGRVRREDFAGLRLLQDKLADRFRGGVVLYTGQRSYTYEDRLHVVPIDRLWQPLTGAA